MWEVTLPPAGELEAQGPYGQHSQLACCGPLKRCGRGHTQSLNIWSGRANEEKGKEVLSRWSLGRCIHCDLSWVDSILFGVQGIKTWWNKPSIPCHPGWWVIFFPRATPLLMDPRGTDTYFIDTHLLEGRLQHLEVVDVFVF